MKGETGKRIDTGKRVMNHSITHPEDTPGFTAAKADLGQLLGRADTLELQQRAGLTDAQAVTLLKRGLRREISGGPVRHLASVSRKAVGDAPELRKKFVLKGVRRFEDFRIAARAMLSDALAHKDTLVKHGLSESVLGELSGMLDRLDAALQMGITSRAAHTGASAELDKIGREIVRVVAVLDGLNRTRFEKDSVELASWQSARSVFGPPASQPGATEPPAPVVPPAADGKEGQTAA